LKRYLNERGEPGEATFCSNDITGRGDWRLGGLFDEGLEGGFEPA